MRRVVAVIGFALSTLPAAAGAQTRLQPTPAPAVTAESEPWFVSRAPLLLGGILYFPAGPQVHFNQNEMVASGFYGRVPLYVQTTLEPRSIVFVPLSGGLMQPYERRRSGDLAGTEGSRPPSFPVDNAAEGTVSRTLEAAVPPAFSSTPQPLPRAVGTTGTVDAVRRQPFASASRPQGLNGIFITYSDRRWFNAGEAVPFDASFRRIGSYADLPVYSRDDAPETIFVPVSARASALVVPYSTVRAR